LQMEDTDLAAVLRQSIILAETKVSRGDIAEILYVAADQPMLEGDSHQLCQVFTNLLTNAFEALNGRGAVSITAAVAYPEDDQALMPGASPAVVVDVVDNGPGVPPELTDRIFNPFFTTKTTGTGLGLAIVSKIVDAHDGRIDVSSSPATGTRFRITVPMTNAAGWFK
jgi:signal transduction histidine kinase